MQCPCIRTAGASGPARINAYGSSKFKAGRGVVPVKFDLSQGGSPTCALPAATIALTKTAGSDPGPVNEST